MGLPDLNLTLQAIGFRVLALLIVAGVHGGCIAAASVILGDRGPKYDGRLSILPTRHIDLVGAFSLIVFGQGWSRPVTVDAREFRTGRIGIVIVILAGFAGLLVTAGVLGALIRPAVTTLPHSAALATAAFLRTAVEVTIRVALFSLVPIPPLAGGMLPQAFGIAFPPRVRWLLIAVLLAAVATGAVRQLLGPAGAVLTTLILGG
jgi:hypothetical protein